MFQRHVIKRLEWRVLLPLFFLFPPVLLSFLQGQDSVLLLLIMTLAVVELKRDRNFTAGFFSGFWVILIPILFFFFFFGGFHRAVGVPPRVCLCFRKLSSCLFHTFPL